MRAGLLTYTLILNQIWSKQYLTWMAVCCYRQVADYIASCENIIITFLISRPLLVEKREDVHSNMILSTLPRSLCRTVACMRTRFVRSVHAVSGVCGLCGVEGVDAHSVIRVQRRSCIELSAQDGKQISTSGPVVHSKKHTMQRSWMGTVSANVHIRELKCAGTRAFYTTTDTPFN